MRWMTWRPPRIRPTSVYRFPRRALTLCPQLYMSIQPDARFPVWSAGALPATLYGHFTQAIYRSRPIAPEGLTRARMTWSGGLTRGYQFNPTSIP